MKILVINSGSSSVKFQVFDMTDESVICKGIVEKIGTKIALVKLKIPKEITKKQEILDHKSAIAVVLNLIVDPEMGIISKLSDISAVGHRVVHGGEFFSKTELITPEIMTAINECITLAPLHNPPNIRGIQACEELMPGIPQVAVFDTAFHQTIPEHAYLYGLPYIIYKRHKIRRYGFHGTSHKYAARKAAEFLNRSIGELKIITSHLGNGASISAIKNGRSIDTSMGFTPLEGLVMGTRCGDLDPAIIPFLIEKDQLSPTGVNNLMNKHSGVYGLAGMETSDMRDLQKAEENGHPGAKRARTLYAYRVKKYIGAYSAALGGLDVLVFTGGIGENDWDIRERSTSDLAYLGIELDIEKNRTNAHTLISTGPVKVLIVKADEELVIAGESRDILESIRSSE